MIFITISIRRAELARSTHELRQLAYRRIEGYLTLTARLPSRLGLIIRSAYRYTEDYTVSPLTSNLTMKP
ncbi:hypothetical protein PM082_019672 [Marasmius tenuissimus]|nr:hypothetical protein PM082_019672 [Marasmius tenuissimus]